MSNIFEKKEAPSTQWVGVTNGIVNSRFGAVHVVQIADEASGKPLYDGIIFVEGKGVINVIADIEDPDDPKIAFVTQVRLAVINPDYLNTIWGKGVPDIFDPEVKKHMGVLITELPRGFNLDNDILSEGEEETQRKIELVAEIGNVNANTANTATSPQIIVAKATKLPSNREQDPNEKIKSVLWLRPEEIREMIDLCGFSMAILWKFRVWCLNNSDPVWKSLGEKL